MPETFVPLVSAPSARAAAFSSLTFTNSTSAPSSASPAPVTDKCGKPTVTLQKTGDVVSMIRVQCGCGQVTELNCVY